MRKRSAEGRPSGFDDSLWARRLVERRLRADASAARRTAPAGLHARTMANLDRAPRGEVVTTSGVAWGGSLAYATAAGLLLLVAALAWMGRSAPSPAPASAVASGDAGVMPVIEFDPAPLWSAIERRAERLDAPWSAPLVAEARLVMADAERAADSVLARLPGRPIRLSQATLDDVRTVRPASTGDERPRAFPWNRLELP